MLNSARAMTAATFPSSDDFVLTDSHRGYLVPYFRLNLDSPLAELIALLSVGAVPVDPAAFMEAVTHHALAKQNKDDCQDDHE